ncbi:MAG: Dihydroorotase, partial [uncultured Blastococcus sp.]
GGDRPARLARRRRPDVGPARRHRPPGRAREPLAGPPAGSGRAGQPAAPGSRAPGAGRPGRAGQPQPQQPLRRPGAARPCGPHVPERCADGARRQGDQM